MCNVYLISKRFTNFARFLSSNQITGIENNAFAGLVALTNL